jgi:hypothetical protein
MQLFGPNLLILLQHRQQVMMIPAALSGPVPVGGTAQVLHCICGAVLC